MKKQISLVLLLFIFNLSYSQNYFKNKIYLLPTHYLINDYIIGYEYSYTENKAINLEIGYGTNPVFIKSVLNFLYDKKFILRLGNKFYISKSTKGTRGYIEPTLSYIYSSYKEKRVNGVVLTAGPPQYTLLQSVDAGSYCLDIIYGREFFYKPRLSFDCYIGLGGRYRISNTTVLSRSPEPPIQFQETYPKYFTARRFLPSIVLGVKFAFSFTQRNK